MSLLTDFSIQLYSLREETAQGFDKALNKIRQIGYSGVEFAGYGDLPAEEMKALLDKNNLTSVGSHISIERLTQHLQQELEYNKILGTEYLVIPYYDFKTQQDVDKFVAVVKEIGPAIREAGFGFAYHNHAHEFEKIDGIYILDHLMNEIPSDLMSLELDVYWAMYAGLDPLEYLQKHNDRITLVHIKQIKDMDTKECCDLDEGIIDFKPLIEAAKNGACRHFILEQESFKTDAYTSISVGYNHIMSL